MALDTALTDDILDTPAFRAWAGTAARPLSHDEIGDHDWSRQGPHLVRVHHGTTHRFSRFDLSRAHHGTAYGKVIYFTSSERDARDNYASPNGPDLKNRIEERFERLHDEMLEDPESFGLDPDMPGYTLEAHARARATAELVGPVRDVHDLVLRIDRPFVLDETRQVDPPVFPDAVSWGEAVEEVAARHGLDPQALDEDPGEHEDEIVEAADATYLDLVSAVATAAARAGCDTPELPGICTPLDEITCSEFEDLFTASPGYQYLDNEDGELVTSTFFAALLEALGFDAIVLLRADRRFRSMEIEHGTAHFHLMASRAAQVKSLLNRGTFDPGDADFLK